MSAMFVVIFKKLRRIVSISTPTPSSPYTYLIDDDGKRLIDDDGKQLIDDTI